MALLNFTYIKICTGILLRVCKWNCDYIVQTTIQDIQQQPHDVSNIILSFTVLYSPKI